MDVESYKLHKLPPCKVGSKVKLKLSLCLTSHHTKKIKGGVEV
jgi:hypothetical protein